MILLVGQFLLILHLWKFKMPILHLWKFKMPILKAKKIEYNNYCN